MGQTFKWGERSGEERRFSAENHLRNLSEKPQGASARKSTKRGVLNQ
jgi:hypothetical protein